MNGGPATGRFPRRTRDPVDELDAPLLSLLVNVADLVALAGGPLAGPLDAAAPRVFHGAAQKPALWNTRRLLALARLTGRIGGQPLLAVMVAP